jgi:hypothetical protein
MITAQESSPRLPFDLAPPVFRSWPTPRVVVMFATVLGAGVLLDLPVELLGLMGERNRIAPVTLITTLALSVWLVRRALRTDTSATNAAWCLAGGAMAGACNAVINCLVLLSSGGPASLLDGLALVIPFWWFFVLVGGVPGVIYGLTFLPLCELGLRMARNPSHRDSWNAMYWSGTWLLAVSLVSQLLLRHATLLAVAATAAGLMLLLGAFVGDVQLCAWLQRLRTGQTPWLLVDRDPNRRYPELLPLGRWVPTALCDQVLVRPPAVGDGPYRTAAREQEIALLPEEADRMALEGLGRTLLTLMVGVCLLALLP